MSYRCQMCGTARPAGEAPVRKVLETRRRSYPVRRDPTDSAAVIDSGGAGVEIVREASICPECASKETAP